MISNKNKIDTSDIPEITDFSTARPNPYAEKIKKHGYSITIHYSPEDVAKMMDDTFDKIRSGQIACSMIQYNNEKTNIKPRNEMPCLRLSGKSIKKGI